MRVLVVGWISLSVTATGVAGTVLCLGADGHMALETAHEVHCLHEGDADSHEHHADDEILAKVHGIFCGPCVDVSLSTDILSQSITQARHVLCVHSPSMRSLNAVWDLGLENDLASLAESHLREGPPRVPDSPRAHRVALLRI